MKVVSLIPYWSQYIGNENNKMSRNIMKVGGRYLINYSIEKLDGTSNIDDVVIYSSSSDIKRYIENDLKYQFLTRPKWLDDNGVTIEQIIKQFLQDSDADVIALLHPNSPFLNPKTITECVSKVVSGEYDSAFTGYKFQKLAWYKGVPLNYAQDKKVPTLSQVEPVIFEQASLYVFSRRMFDKFERRIGKKPFIKFIDHFEGFDVNTKEDLDIAELIVNSGMYNTI